MSVLIKGMEMPTSCYVCPFCDYVSARCDAVKGNPYTPTNRYDARAEWCPIVPVPEHGDLIDRDAATKKIWDDMRFPSNLANAQFFVNELREMPAIIPADPAEEVDNA